MNLIDGKIVESIVEFKKIFLAKKNWNQAPLSSEVLFLALEKIRTELLVKGNFYHLLVRDLEQRGDLSADEINLSMQGLIEFINIDQLRVKLSREFGSEHPFELKRINFRENNFESWSPLGVLVHITPSNAALLSVLGVIEGLLSANVNVLKLGRKDSEFAILFYQKLIEFDSTDLLKNFIIIGKVSSKDQAFMKEFLSVADVVSAWGNEESLKSIKELLNSHVRVVEWGHKISFSYFSKTMISDVKSLEKLSYEICNNEQQACSSPQCVFVEDADFETLTMFADNLAKALNKISPTIKRVLPTTSEQCEITVVKEQVRLESFFSKAEVVEANDRSWRLLVDMKEGLEASPLFRTLWIKPLKKKDIISTLRPLRSYLQTVGVATDSLEIEELVQLFFRAGVQRVRAIGEMTDSYIGEPHDGVLALTRFCQRISYTDSGLMNEKACFEIKKIDGKKIDSKIMTKADFQNSKVESKYSDLFFHSGGSSGEPKLSIFTYEDYHRQMELASEGLYGAGLNPATDRCMNLFYAGNLYGGFVSFFTILETMKAVQFPMGASTEYQMVADTIVKNKVDTILGMPSYIMQLFNQSKDILKNYRGIKKIFYGGEHMSLAQREFLKKEFGVEIVRSATYGSVDAGPLGFQCSKSSGGVHHLHSRLHDLEVVDLENDIPVMNGEIGRLLFTSKVRNGQSIKRYEIGDVGKIIDGVCACGRKGVRFELLGRHGDVFRIGSIFLSYQKFQKILVDYFEYEGAFQLHLFSENPTAKEKCELRIENIIKNKTNIDNKIFHR